MRPEVQELAELVADVRAAAADAVLRGFHHGPEGELPELAPAEEPEVVRGPAPEQGWSELAAEARSVDHSGARALSRVRDELGDCRRCQLCTTRRTLVFGVGNPDADLVVMGEAPGAQEDRQGEPFVGPSGQMLDKMLANVLGIPREQAYILNVVKCRPPDNRNPLPAEVAACRPFLEAQLAAIRPRVVLVLGGVAYQALFDTGRGITRARGSWQDYRGIAVMPTYHPAYLLRNPEKKRETFVDLKEVRRRLEGA